MSTAGLPSHRGSFSQDQINRFARVTGDRNPIHVDEAFARQTEFGGTIAHGIMTLSLLIQSLGHASRSPWPTGLHLGVAFIAPVRPGDTVTVSGQSVEGDGTRRYDLRCTRQTGDPVIVGTAAFPS